MGILLLHKMLRTYNVDEAIETLPISPNTRVRVETYLMMYAPTAYLAPGVSLALIWKQLPTDVQEALNQAAIKTYTKRDEYLNGIMKHKTPEWAQEDEI